MFDTIRWKGNSVEMLDQRLLPVQEAYQVFHSYKEVAFAIREMVVRGAPAIGIAAAMGIALAAREVSSFNMDVFRREMDDVMNVFAATRPTAVNLFHAIERMRKVLSSAASVESAIDILEKEALQILKEDVDANRAMGQNGSRFLEDGDAVLTHCNAGALATGGYGTALGVIRAAVEQGKKIEVYACETRPFLQGARLTAWELTRDGIPVTLITDNMAGYFMRQGIIKKVIVGADRIAANGDTANKIGTYSLSVLAKHHNIPFLVAAPLTTLDPATADGSGIPIEERSIDEVAYIRGEQIAPEGVHIRNPAFDVTPAANITAIITEKGVIENPARDGIKGFAGN